MKKLQLLALAASLSLAAGGCKKKEPEAAPAPAAPAAKTPAAPAPAPTPAPAPAATPADPKADYFTVTANHTDATKGPVDVQFKGIKVVKADFDPAKIEGGSAELAIDVASLDSGIPDRNKHLQTPDFLDAAKFGTIDIKIADVKKGTADKTFTADADVSAHGIDKKLPVTFTVVDQTADSIRIQATQAIKLADFGIGDAGGKVTPDLTVKLQVTLKKS